MGKNGKKLGKNREYSKEFLEKIWKPGQSGNPSGRPPGPDLVKIMKEELCKYVVDDDGKKRTAAQELIRVIIKGAMKGNHHQQKMLVGYLHGLPKASLEVTQHSLPFEEADEKELADIIKSARITGNGE